jgi:hypothetical protein
VANILTWAALWDLEHGGRNRRVHENACRYFDDPALQGTPTEDDRAASLSWSR